MTAWSQSPFLQALGWAMLNSFWQMALLFIGFSVLQHFLQLSSERKYAIATGCLGIGLLWFLYTFFSFYNQGTSGTILARHPLAPTSQTWNLLLSSASLAYLLLLLVPAYRLLKNWRYIERLKNCGQQKTAMEYRLFVKKVAQHLGIKHSVHVYLSQLVQSPVTVGYLKPIILLPIAAVNSLSPQQVEAVLLHELSHIKRYDYLINLIITFLQTLFYYNPFVKKFVSIIEFEREKCCDELVMQFQYDRLSYASALLQLEKNVLAEEALAVAAAGKKHLLCRIKRIIGLEEKPRLTFHQFAGLLASFIMALFIHSLFFVNTEVPLANSPTFAAFENPLYEFDSSPASGTYVKSEASKRDSKDKAVVCNMEIEVPQTELITLVPQSEPLDPAIIPVAYDALDEMVTIEEHEQITETLDATKKVLTKSKWKEVEASIADGMTAAEKTLAKHEYLSELNNVNWEKLEAHLKSEYEKIDWTAIEQKLDYALFELKLDSLRTNYHSILTQIQKSESKAKAGCIKAAALPLPDATVKELSTIKEELKIKIDSIEVIRQHKVIDF